MSYAHYWDRKLEISRDAFDAVVSDARIIFDRAIDLGIRLAGPAGVGKPEASGDTIAFNGMMRCGHRYRDLGHPFASDKATGVEEVDPPYDPKEEPWVGKGPYLNTRVCGGSCAGEAFLFDRKYLVRDWERQDSPGRYACSCMTNFKPYDLIVTAVLIRLKERLGDAVTLSSENPWHGFDDAKRLCRELFGFLSYFEVKTPDAEVVR